MSYAYTSQLPDEVRKYAAETLHETEEAIKHGFDQIRSFATKNPHLHIRTEDKYILPFLRNCKFNIDKTKEKLKNFYIMKRDRTELFTNRNPHLPEVQELISMGCFVILKEAYENQTIVLINPTLHNPKCHTLNDILKVSMMVEDIEMIENQIGQIYGLIAIIDLKNISFAVAKQCSIPFMRHAVQIMQNYYFRPQKIAFINAPFFVRFVLNMFKTIMPEKIRSRVHVGYEGANSLNTFIDVTILPENYGGEAGSLQDLGKYWNQKLLSYDTWFAEDEKYKAE